MYNFYFDSESVAENPDGTKLKPYSSFEQCKNSKAKIWGIKEKTLPLEQMKELFAYMKKNC